MGFDVGVIWFIKENVFRINSPDSLRAQNCTQVLITVIVRVMSLRRHKNLNRQEP